MARRTLARTSAGANAGTYVLKPVAMAAAPVSSSVGRTGHMATGSTSSPSSLASAYRSSSSARNTKRSSGVPYVVM